MREQLKWNQKLAATNALQDQLPHCDVPDGITPINGLKNLSVNLYIEQFQSPQPTKAVQNQHEWEPVLFYLTMSRSGTKLNGFR